MGCNCGKKKKTVPTITASGATVMTAVPTKSYDVVDGDGGVVASTTNLVFARVEARRVGGTVVPSSTASVSQA